MNKEHCLESYRKMGKNFMTPTVKDYVLTPDDRIVELAVGSGMGGEKIWGVSEFQYEHSSLQTTRRGQCFTRLVDARRYFNILLGVN